MLDRIRASLARRSFDYQWAAISRGDFLLDDPGFGGDVDAILSEEELQVDREWFKGRRVLDAGCGQGRWVEGFVRLGCDVTAMDVSQAALQQVRERHGDAVRVVEGDVLKADQILEGERFDLVFSWGVLHHTRDTAGGIQALSRLMVDDGLMYLYLYGPLAMKRSAELRLGARRAALNLLPLRARHAWIERRYGPEQAHAMFDLLSTPLNKRYTLEQATEMLHAAGLGRVTVTLPHTELFIRADRGHSSADPFLLPRPEPPFWFERLLARNAPAEAEAQASGA